MRFHFKSLAGIEEHIFGDNEMRHKTDSENGGEYLVPAGGYAEHSIQGLLVGDGERIQRFRIDWQDGPVDRSGVDQPPEGERTETGVNGASVEDVLEVCRLRLKCYEGSSFACVEYADAIKHIERALFALENRRNDLRGRCVEGQNKE